MSTANQHSRTSVQRLQGKEIATLPSGSQGLDPRTLRSERLKWLRTYAKSEPAAQIAAFLTWNDLCQPSYIPHAEELRASEASKHGPVTGQFALRGPLAGAPQGEGRWNSTRRAFAHHSSSTLFDGRKGQSLAGNSPSTFFPTHNRLPPPGAG